MRVLDEDALDLLAVLQVFAQDRPGTQQAGRSNDQCIPERC